MVLVDNLDGLEHPGHLRVHVLPSRRRGHGTVAAVHDGGRGGLGAESAHVGLRLGNASPAEPLLPRLAAEDVLDEDLLHGLLPNEVLPQAADGRRAATRPAWREDCTKCTQYGLEGICRNEIFEEALCGMANIRFRSST